MIRLACSMRRTTDPRRPRRLTDEDLKALDREPTLHRLKRRKDDLCKERDRLRKAPPDQYQRAQQEYEQARREYRNNRQRAAYRLLRRKREKYQREQPVRDLERQLCGNIPADEVMGALPDSPVMSHQHLALVEAVLQPPGDTLELDLCRRIAAINAVNAYCGVVEGAVPRPAQRRQHGAGQREKEEEEERLLREAKAKVFVKSRKERPRVCFLCLCLGDEGKSVYQRVYTYSSPGSLTRHLKTCHLRCHWGGKSAVFLMRRRFHLQNDANEPRRGQTRDRHSGCECDMHMHIMYEQSYYTEKHCIYIYNIDTVRMINRLGR